MTKDEIIDRLTDHIATENGWDEPEDVAQAREQAESVVDYLEKLRVLRIAS